MMCHRKVMQHLGGAFLSPQQLPSDAAGCVLVIVVAGMGLIAGFAWRCREYGSMFGSTRQWVRMLQLSQLRYDAVEYGHAIGLCGLMVAA
jgi:hypothetical protein